MSYFAVIREAGPVWASGGIYNQPAVDEHAAFMSALAEDGFLLSRDRSRAANVGASACC